MTTQLWKGYETGASTLLSTELTNLGDGARHPTAAIDNTTRLDMFDDVELLIGAFTATLDADAHFKLYLLPSIDGTNYVDGASDVVPADSNEVYTALVNPANAGTQRLGFRGIVLPPGLFKYLLVNESSGKIDDATSTLKRRPYNIKAT